MPHYDVIGNITDVLIDIFYLLMHLIIFLIIFFKQGTSCHLVFPSSKLWSLSEFTIYIFFVVARTLREVGGKGLATKKKGTFFGALK